MTYLGEDKKKLNLDIKHPKNMVFVSGGFNLTGCYSSVHISPFWFQICSPQCTEAPTCTCILSF